MRDAKHSQTNIWPKRPINWIPGRQDNLSRCDQMFPKIYYWDFVFPQFPNLLIKQFVLGVRSTCNFQISWKSLGNLGTICSLFNNLSSCCLLAGLARLLVTRRGNFFVKAYHFKSSGYFLMEKRPKSQIKCCCVILVILIAIKQKKTTIKFPDLSR